MRAATPFVRSVVFVYRDRDIPFLAASIAFSAFLSLLPLVVLVILAAGLLGGTAFREYVRTVAEGYLTAGVAGVVGDAVGSGEHVGVSIFGLLVLLWAMLKVFRALDTAFSKVYRSSLDTGFLDQVRDGLVVFVAMTTAILTAVAAGAVLAILPAQFPRVASSLPFLEGVAAISLVVGLTAAFLPMYYVFPDTQVTVLEVLPGAVFAALGWTLLEGLFALYVALSTGSQVFGVIGGVILFFTWLYFGAVVVLLGAATNVVLAGRAHPLTETAVQGDLADG